MTVSGASPIYLGIYQFIIVAMILAIYRASKPSASGAMKQRSAYFGTL
jgi:hypothetical protein